MSQGIVGACTPRKFCAIVSLFSCRMRHSTATSVLSRAEIFMPLVTWLHCNQKLMENSYIGLNNLNMSNLFKYIKKKIAMESSLRVINLFCLHVYNHLYMTNHQTICSGRCPEHTWLPVVQLSVIAVVHSQQCEFIQPICRHCTSQIGFHPSENWERPPCFTGADWRSTVYKDKLPDVGQKQFFPGSKGVGEV